MERTLSTKHQHIGQHGAINESGGSKLKAWQLAAGVWSIPLLVAGVGTEIGVMVTPVPAGGEFRLTYLRLNTCCSYCKVLPSSWSF